MPARVFVLFILTFLATFVAVFYAPDYIGDGGTDVALPYDEEDLRAKVKPLRNLLPTGSKTAEAVRLAEEEKRRQAEAMAKWEKEFAEWQDKYRGHFERIDREVAEGRMSRTHAEHVRKGLLSTRPTRPGGVAVEATRKDLKKAARESGRSSAELRDLEMRLRHFDAAKVARDCPVPKPKADTRIVLFGRYHGTALSTLGLGDDRAVAVADVVIDRGNGPLYLWMEHFEGVIWRFSGAVDRVERAVFGGHRPTRDGKPRIGVVGLPKEKIAFAGCMRNFTQAVSVDAMVARRVVEAVLGRKPDQVLAIERIGTAHLPNGKFERATLSDGRIKIRTRGPAAALWQEVQRRYPSGLIGIDPKEVVAETSVARHDLLPGEAGLAKLVADGAVKIIGSQSVSRLQGATGPLTTDEKGRVSLPAGGRLAAMNLPYKYLVLRKIRIPNGVGGPFGAVFVLKDGVPPPDNARGHTILREDGSEVKGAG